MTWFAAELVDDVPLEQADPFRLMRRVAPAVEAPPAPELNPLQSARLVLVLGRALKQRRAGR